MKISVVINKEDERILRVESFSRYNKTEEEIQKAIDNINGNPENRQRYEVVEVDDDSTIGKALTLLLGASKYRYSYKIGELVDKIEDLKESIECVDNDINDIYRGIESLQFKIKEIKGDE